MKIFTCSLLFCLVLIFSHSSGLAADKNYHIGPGDILEISVWKDPELSRQLTVPPDGIISFPLIEPIKVTNMTVLNLKQKVTQKLSEFVPEATVTVLLLEINSLKAYVIGKVNKSGEFYINMETTVMQILAKAGGLNPFASRGKIEILRQQDNKIIKIPFDYGQVEKGNNLQQNIILKTGDVVVVP
jgi:polysaccharide export outer membrane protein